MLGKIKKLGQKRCFRMLLGHLGTYLALISAVINTSYALGD
jgi:hypothetical protein